MLKDCVWEGECARFPNEYVFLYVSLGFMCLRIKSYSSDCGDIGVHKSVFAWVCVLVYYSKCIVQPELFFTQEDALNTLMKEGKQVWKNREILQEFRQPI